MYLVVTGKDRTRLTAFIMKSITFLESASPRMRDKQESVLLWMRDPMIQRERGSNNEVQ
jgi:hypothetical protein